MLRELRVRVKQRGFRSLVVVVVTSLLDAEEFPPSEIAELYRRRWQAEVYQPDCTSSAGLYQLAA